MKTLIVSHDDVRKLLPMRECTVVLEEMFKSLARGQAILPLRQVLSLPDRKGSLGLMPGFLGEPKAIVGGKIITVFPGNLATPYESHQGCILLFETDNGRLLAIVDATMVTAIRTAAASAVATKILSKRNASNLAILGSGTQAAMHLSAMQEVRNIKNVTVWGRNKEHLEKFVGRQSDLMKSLNIEAVESAESAVSKADIICTTTSATEPILKGEWLSGGVHINAVGASRPTFRELDSELVARSKVYTDRKESLTNESDDFLIPLKEGIIQETQLIGEIGELLLSKVPGRQNEEEITLFKSLGVATEDLASVYHIYEKARETQSGTWVEFNSSRNE